MYFTLVRLKNDLVRKIFIYLSDTKEAIEDIEGPGRDFEGIFHLIGSL